MGFNLVNLVIKVRTDDPACLRDCLPLLGKEYATACRGLICRWPERECESCSKQETCDWYLVFGQKLASDPAALKRHQKPPLPFVFSFPVLERFTSAQKEIECGLVVIGPAISHLEMLLNGFAELLSKGLTHVAAKVVQIACRDYQGAVQHIAVNIGATRSGHMVPDNLLILSTEGLLESRAWINSTLHIRLRSPLRLLDAGHLVVYFEFSRFARSVLRRVSSLASYYGESELDSDFKELSRNVDDLICMEEQFGYTINKNKKISGITGYGKFSGEFSRLVPFLIIGSYVNVGKNASFGMGAYEVVSDNSGRE